MNTPRCLIDIPFSPFFRSGALPATVPTTALPATVLASADNTKPRRVILVTLSYSDFLRVGTIRFHPSTCQQEIFWLFCMTESWQTFPRLEPIMLIAGTGAKAHPGRKLSRGVLSESVTSSQRDNSTTRTRWKFSAAASCYRPRVHME